jgi:drug/metabolite transporter (DMT)-like permease
VPAVLALLSSAMWGTADYLGGRLTRARNVLLVLAVTQAAGLALMLVVATVSRAWSAPTGYLPWAVLASLTGATGLGLYYRALAIGTMGVVSPIASLGVLVPLLVGVADGERPSPVQVGGIALALLGVVLASGPEVRGEAGWAPVALAGAAAVFLGASLAAIARGSQVSVVMTMTAMRVVTVSLLVVVVLVAVRRTSIARSELPGFAAVGFLDVGANVAFGMATTIGLLSLVSVIGSLYPVATILLARWLDGERLRRVQQVGVVLALAGATAITGG